MGDTQTKTTLGQLSNVVQGLQCADKQSVYKMIVSYFTYFNHITVSKTDGEGEKVLAQWVGTNMDMGVHMVEQMLLEKV